MGSKEEDVPREPVEKTVFVEDMNESELATAVSVALNFVFFFFTELFSYILVGFTCRLEQLRKYMLYECYCSMFEVCPRT